MDTIKHAKTCVHRTEKGVCNAPVTEGHVLKHSDRGRGVQSQLCCSGWSWSHPPGWLNSTRHAVRSGSVRLALTSPSGKEATGAHGAPYADSDIAVYDMGGPWRGRAQGVRPRRKRGTLVLRHCSALHFTNRERRDARGGSVLRYLDSSAAHKPEYRLFLKDA